MAKKQETAAQLMERIRGERELSKDEFARAMGISRQWYHEILNGKVFPVQVLSFVAHDHAGEWNGALAVELMRLYGYEMFIPCVCQTRIGDNGPCPKHGEEIKFEEFLKTCDDEDIEAMALLFANRGMKAAA